MHANHTPNSSEILDDWFMELSIVENALNHSLTHYMTEVGSYEMDEMDGAYSDILYVLRDRLRFLVKNPPSSSFGGSSPEPVILS